MCSQRFSPGQGGKSKKGGDEKDLSGLPAQKKKLSEHVVRKGCLKRTEKPESASKPSRNVFKE